VLAQIVNNGALCLKSLVVGPASYQRDMNFVAAPYLLAREDG
jgi:hypothetical protein